LDDNPATSAAAGGFWDWMYEIDLHRMVPVTRLAVHFRSDAFATHYKIHRSADGKTWETVAERQTDKCETGNFQLDGRTIRFLRIESLLPNGPNQSGGQMSITEVDIF
jgi:hypothetical protein